jgi:diguanylate cyclase (GGDEF)-like protein/PAS domain S-box-containing protein
MQKVIEAVRAGLQGNNNESDRLFCALFEAALDAMVIADDEGRYVAVNPTACDLFGLPQAELLGRCLVDFIHPLTPLEQVWPGFQHPGQTGDQPQGQTRGELTLVRADGAVRQVEYTVTANVVPHRHLWILREVAEQRLMASTDPSANHGPWPVDARSSPAASLELAVGTTPKGHWNLAETNPASDAGNLANLVALIYDVGDRTLAESTLRQQEQEFRTLAENTPDCILRCDREFRFLYVNPAVTTLSQRPRAAMVGKTSEELGYPDALVTLWHGAVAKAWATGQEQSLEYSLALIGNHHTFQARVVPEVTDGAVTSVLVVARDITDLKRAQSELVYRAEREHTLRLMTQRIRETLDLEAILLTAVTEIQRTFQADRTLIFRLNSDHSGVVIQEAVRPAYPVTLAMRWEDECFPPDCYAAYAQGQGRIVSDVELDSWGDCLVEFMEETGVQSKMVAPILQRQSDGSMRVWGLLITHACATPRRWQPDELDLLQQVAEQLAIALHQAELHQQLQTANQELERISNTDALTQIANRRYFDRSLAQEWQRAQREQMPLALILCDIDFFKQYNDTYGHPAGDVCITAVAQVLQGCLHRSGDCLARYGGEEFAVILPHTDQMGAETMARKMQRAIAALNLPHAAHPTAQRITLSFGLAMALPQTGLSPQDLLSRADQALYQAKQTGRNRVCLAPALGELTA